MSGGGYHLPIEFNSDSSGPKVQNPQKFQNGGAFRHSLGRPINHDLHFGPKHQTLTYLLSPRPNTP